MILQSKIDGLREETNNTFKAEIGSLKKIVEDAKDSVNQNNDHIYEQYDQKMRKIKDVCA